MKKKLMTVLALVLVIAMSVAGTYAYLTSQAEVKNTFTVGKVAITLDEAKTNVDGKKVDADGNILAQGATDYRIPNGEDRTNGNEYKLMPGHEYSKDPIVRVTKDSEACYVFVKVVDDIAAIEVNDADTPNVATQIKDNGWTALEGVDGVKNVYYKSVSADDAKNGVNLEVFNGFAIIDTITNTDLAKYNGKTITVTAYAVQADGMTDAADAWTKLGA